MMGLGDRIKKIRKEKKWTQNILARKIGSDVRQISRYENGHVVPSIDAIVKIAEALEVTTDYLLMGNSPPKTLKIKDYELLERIQDVTNLTGKDRESLFHILDALLAKNRVRAIADEIA